MDINIDPVKLIAILDKFRDQLEMLLIACEIYMSENKDFLSILDGPGIDQYMSSFLNNKLRDERIEASFEEIDILGMCISLTLIKDAMKNIEDNGDKI